MSSTFIFKKAIFVPKFYNEKDKDRSLTWKPHPQPLGSSDHYFSCWCAIIYPLFSFTLISFSRTKYLWIALGTCPAKAGSMGMMPMLRMSCSIWCCSATCWLCQFCVSGPAQASILPMRSLESEHFCFLIVQKPAKIISVQKCDSKYHG